MRAADLSPLQQAELIAAFKDHPRFCRESLRIRDRSGSLIPLECWPSQVKLTEAINRQERAGQPVRIVVLKTRRSGFTLGSSSQIFRRTAFFPGRKAFVIADKYDPAALEAFGYFKAFILNYQPFGPANSKIKLQPGIDIAEGDMKLRLGEEVLLDVYSADRGEIRGGGRHWALFDEVAFWRAAQVTLRSAMNMVPDLPETGIIIQSTANGVGGEFYEICMQAQDPASSAGWLFVFFGWLEDPNNQKPFQIIRDDSSSRTTR